MSERETLLGCARCAALLRERDEARALVRESVRWVEAISDALGDDPVDWKQGVQRIRDLRRERDEARAEVERLRAELERPDDGTLLGALARWRSGDE